MKYTAEQKRWCCQYEAITNFDPLMGDFEAGLESFEDAAKHSIGWFESWSSDAFLRVEKVDIPKIKII